MSQDKIYRKIKRHNGERFAQTIRNHHDGLMDLPDLDRIVRHAGRREEDARAILPYLTAQLMEHLAANENDIKETVQQTPRDPFELLKEAGYDAFHADTLEKQNSIKKYFRRGELLCTFNDAARYQNYHIVHAVHRDANTLNRNDFNGKEERQDDQRFSFIL